MITTDEIRKLVDAFDENQKIWFRPRGTVNPWVITGNPSWDFFSEEYSPVPKPRRWVFNLLSSTQQLAVVGYVFTDQDEADRYKNDRVECVHVQEILKE